MTTGQRDREAVRAAVVAFMSSFELPAGTSLKEFLVSVDEAFDDDSRRAEPTEVVTAAEVEGWGIRIAVWRPPGDGPFPVVVHLHGGAWQQGNHVSHKTFLAELAAEGFLVMAPDYRRAPKHRFPAAYDDCALAVRWCAEHAQRWGGDARRLAVSGDSAGGNLAAAVVAGDHDRLVHAAVLLYGIYDYEPALPALSGLGGIAEDQGYVRGADVARHRTDARLNPVHAVDHWPPTYVGVGTDDPLIEQSRLLHARLTDRRVDHVYDERPATPHSYVQVLGHPQQRPGVEAVAAFLHDTLGA